MPRLFCSALYAPFDIALLKVIAHNGFAISAAGTHMSTPIIERHRDAMQRTRAALPAAHHLPGDFYTSPEIQRLERDRIFRREWLCVGRVEEFPNPGDYAALCIADEPVVLCRDRSGKLRAFFNVCRHRGTEVALGCGNSTRFTCPYHAWTYDLDGRLLGAPFTDDIENFDRALFGLKPVNLDSWGGFVFINLDPAARPLADALGVFARSSRRTGRKTAVSPSRFMWSTTATGRPSQRISSTSIISRPFMRIRSAPISHLSPTGLRVIRGAIPAASAV